MKLADRALDAQAGFEISDTILTSFWSRLNEDTAQVLEDKQVLELGKKCLKHSDSNPGVAFLKSVNLKCVINNSQVYDYLQWFNLIFRCRNKFLKS